MPFSVRVAGTADILTLGIISMSCPCVVKRHFTVQLMQTLGKHQLSLGCIHILFNSNFNAAEGVYHILKALKVHRYIFIDSVA